MECFTCYCSHFDPSSWPSTYHEACEGGDPRENASLHLQYMILASSVLLFKSVIQQLFKGLRHQRESVQYMKYVRFCSEKLRGISLGSISVLVLKCHCFICKEGATVWFSHDNWENALCNGTREVFHRGLKREFSFQLLTFFLKDFLEEFLVA